MSNERVVRAGESEEERELYLMGYYDQDAPDEDEYESMYYDCDVCGGEFWDGGMSCTCEGEEEEE